MCVYVIFYIARYTNCIKNVISLVAVEAVIHYIYSTIVYSTILYYNIYTIYTKVVNTTRFMFK